MVAELPVANGSKKGLVISVNIYIPATEEAQGWENTPENQVLKLFANSFRYAMQYVCTHNNT